MVLSEMCSCGRDISPAFLKKENKQKRKKRIINDIGAGNYVLVISTSYGLLCTKGSVAGLGFRAKK